MPQVRFAYMCQIRSIRRVRDVPDFLVVGWLGTPVAPQKSSPGGKFMGRRGKSGYRHERSFQVIPK